MFSKRKGITPVIAIVLLLLITVGAVGVVYTQFQSLTGGEQAQDELNSQQKLQNADYAIQGVQKVGTSPSEYQVYIKNTGDSTYNLSSSSTLYVGENGDSPVALNVAGGSCDWSTGTLAPGDTANCNTGITWEDSYQNDGQSTEFELRIQDTRMASYQCDETSSDTC